MVKKFVPSVATRMTAIVAEIKCPPIKFRGCERGASGTANKRTAVAPNDPIRSEWPDKFVMARIDQMDTVLLIKLQMANRRERLFRFTVRGALILFGKLLNLLFSVVHPNFFHLVDKTKCRLVRSIIK